VRRTKLHFCSRKCAQEYQRTQGQRFYNANGGRKLVDDWKQKVKQKTTVGEICGK